MFPLNVSAATVQFSIEKTCIQSEASRSGSIRWPSFSRSYKKLVYGLHVRLRVLADVIHRSVLARSGVRHTAIMSGLCGGDGEVYFEVRHSGEGVAAGSMSERAKDPGS